MRQLAGNIGGKMASKRQLGGNLGHLKANLRPTRGQDEIGVMVHVGMREAIFSSAGIGNIIKPCPSGRNLTQRAGLKAAAGFIASRIPPGRVEGRRAHSPISQKM